MEMQQTLLPPRAGRPMPRGDNREALDEWFRELAANFGEAPAMAIIKSLVATLGGRRITVPDREELQREERDRRIRARFNGRNYEEIALSFRLSIRQVRSIIDDCRRPPRPRNPAE